MERCVPLQGLGYKIFMCIIISSSICWPACENLANNFKGLADENGHTMEGGLGPESLSRRFSSKYPTGL